MLERGSVQRPPEARRVERNESVQPVYSQLVSLGLPLPFLKATKTKHSHLSMSLNFSRVSWWVKRQLRSHSIRCRSFSSGKRLMTGTGGIGVAVGSCWCTRSWFWYSVCVWPAWVRMALSERLQGLRISMLKRLSNGFDWGG